MRKTIVVVVTAIALTAGGGTVAAHASDFISNDALKNRSSGGAAGSGNDYDRGCSKAYKCRQDGNR